MGLVVHDSSLEMRESLITNTVPSPDIDGVALDALSLGGLLIENCVFTNNHKVGLHFHRFECG